MEIFSTLWGVNKRTKLIDPDFTRRLCLVAEVNGLGPAELAALFGRDQSAARQWLSGATKPRMPVAEFTGKFGLTVAQFYAPRIDDLKRAAKAAAIARNRKAAS